MWILECIKFMLYRSHPLMIVFNYLFTVAHKSCIDAVAHKSGIDAGVVSQKTHLMQYGTQNV